MEKIRRRWDISSNWQFVFPFLGVVLMLLTAYYISRRLLHLYNLNNTSFEWPFTLVLSAVFYYVMYKFFLWCFEKLKHKWPVNERWEMIAIFIVFAITGSVSGRLAGPFTELIGLSSENVNPWIFWTARILLIFPIYQILLVLFGWCFGQFGFFWNFEKKMLRRMGLGFLIP